MADQYFLIKPFRGEYAGKVGDVVALVAFPTTYEKWRGAPEAYEEMKELGMFVWANDRPYGRRVNDEVELFTGLDGKVRIS